MFKFNNTKLRIRCEICSTLTIKTSEQRHWLLPTNCLSVFDYFVGLAVRGVITFVLRSWPWLVVTWLVVSYLSSLFHILLACLLKLVLVVFTLFELTQYLFPVLRLFLSVHFSLFKQFWNTWVAWHTLH